MAGKKRLSEQEVEYYANMSDSDWDDMFGDGNDSDQEDYVPSNESSEEADEDSSEDEVSRPTDAEDTVMPIQDNETEDNETDNDLWIEIAQAPPNFVFTENIGLKIDCTNFEIEDLVKLFFSEQFLDLLVTQTNLYATQVIEKLGPIRRSNRMSKWKETNIPEMKVFLGLLLHMGPCSFPSVEHYWSTNVLYTTTFWRRIMSRNRFQLLLRFFHFTDNSIESNDRLYKIRPILDHFNNIMSSNYIPNKSLCIDESMVLWRGRLFFRQYIKNKKHKYGIKLYELCESNGLVLKIKIYCGKSEQSENEMGHTSDVVLHLMKDYLDKGYVLYMDNFYNSVTLTNLLSTRKTYVCGTLRNNRKGNPKDIVKKKLKKGEYAWKRNNSTVVCKWKDKREVLTISNMHMVEMVEVHNKNGKVSMKPNIIRDYNTGMSGIDQADQMLSYYSALRKTIRWPKKIALHIFEIYIHNAHIMFHKIKGPTINMKSLKFREKIIECLIGDKMPNIIKKSRIQEEFHYLETLPPTEKKQCPTKPCRVCNKKKRRESRYFCPVCQEKPAMCVEKCFKQYHQ